MWSRSLAGSEFKGRCHGSIDSGQIAARLSNSLRPRAFAVYATPANYFCATLDFSSEQRDVVHAMLNS